MTITKLEKIMGLGTLISLGVVYLGKCADLPPLTVGGTISSFTCFTGFIASYIRGCHLDSKKLDLDYRALRKKVGNEIEGLENKTDRDCYKELVNDIDKKYFL